jgi:hypothetical protein
MQVERIGEEETGAEQKGEEETQAEQIGGRETPEANMKKTTEARREILKEAWKDWLAEKDYRLLILYKLGGELGWQNEDLGRQEKRKLRERAKRFVMGCGVGEYQPLFYREEDGSLSHCVKNRDIERTLATIHDTHGHFSTGITAGRAYGRYYWPTRMRDIGSWVASCPVCQRVGPLRQSGQLKTIVQFSPFDMIGMDYVGPISPPCKVTGNRFILIMVNYFSRFLFARGFAEYPSQATTMSMLLDSIAPIFGWPKTIFCDNGSYFVGKEVKKLLDTFGVKMINAPITHPSSVGLSERYVQMIVGRIRLQCIGRGSTDDWGLHISLAVIDINTRQIRIHGFSPAEILLGYNPASSLHEPETARGWLASAESIEDMLGSDANQLKYFTMKRNEQREYTSSQLCHSQDKKESSHQPKWEGPWKGDLVLVRDVALDNQKGGKLRPRWHAPRIVEDIVENGNTALVRELHHAPDHTKKYHFDDLKVYVQRYSGERARDISYERTTMASPFISANSVGQRAFHLTT